MQLTEDETRRLPFHLVAQRLLFRQHPLWRRPNRTVIEVRATGVKHPVLEHGTTESRHADILSSRIAAAADH
jgi:hypothetical protein